MGITTELVIGSCVCIWIIIITSIILFACSFSILELDEYGVIYNNNKKIIENDTYTSGRHFIGLGKKFKVFPRKFKTVEFSNDSGSEGDPLSAWTSDGLSVWIDLSFHFSLDKKKLRDLYYQFGDDWYSSVVRIATTTIKDTCPNFQTEDYFLNREVISQTFSDQLTIKFQQYTSDAIVLQDLQLRNIKFDGEYESAIITKLIEEQKKRTYEVLKDIQTTQKMIEVINTEATLNVNYIYAEEQAKGLKKTEKAKSDSFQSIVGSLANQYKQLFDSMDVKLQSLSPPKSKFSIDEKLKFIYSNEIGVIEGTKAETYLGIKKPYLKSGGGET